MDTGHELLTLPTVDGDLREAAWDAYSDSFEELRAAAIQRHVMTREEFDEVMADPRVTIYLTRHEDGQVSALASLTNDLSTMPLVSPDFFAARWPEHYSAGRCWYIGFVAVRPAFQATGVFANLVGTVAGTLGPRGGVLVLDVPKRNMEHFHVPQAVKRIADHVVPDVSYEMVDAQGYWAYTTPVPADEPDGGVVVDLRDGVTVTRPAAADG